MEVAMVRRSTLLSLALSGALACLCSQADAASPIVLKFAKGSYGVMAQGHVTASAPQQVFRVDVEAGQVMIITFAGAGTMRGSVACQGGVGDGPYDGTGNSITIKVSGNCDISVGANTMASEWTGDFTLAVLVYRPR
jgi:hypothetical protein